MAMVSAVKEMLNVSNCRGPAASLIECSLRTLFQIRNPKFSLLRCRHEAQLRHKPGD
jgi:hypothetical protein